MDIRQIERLMRTMQQYGVTSLELSEGDTKLCLARNEEPPAQAVLVAEAALATLPPVLPTPTDSAPEMPKQGGGKEVLSPMVGTFHPHPKNPVKLGSKLKKGDVLCVIEAMKLMNDIVMEEDGEITFLALKDGDMVEFGQVIAQYK